MERPAAAAAFLTIAGPGKASHKNTNGIRKKQMPSWKLKSGRTHMVFTASAKHSNPLPMTAPNPCPGRDQAPARKRLAIGVA